MGKIFAGLYGVSLKVVKKCLLGQGEHMGNVTGMQNNKSITNRLLMITIASCFYLMIYSISQISASTREHS
jgi:hypothetical protein